MKYILFQNIFPKRNYSLCPTNFAGVQFPSHPTFQKAMGEAAAKNLHNFSLLPEAPFSNSKPKY